MTTEDIKLNTGIAVANCQSCAHLSYENDGGEPEFSTSWAVCRKFEKYQYLKPFPFKTEQKCWTPEFWQSKFTKLIDGSDESVMHAIGEFNKAIGTVK